MNACVLENLGTGWFLRAAFGHGNPPWPSAGVLRVHLSLASNSQVWGHPGLDLTLGAPFLTLPYAPRYYETLVLAPEQMTVLDAEVARRGGVSRRGIRPDMKVTVTWEVL